MHFDISTAIEKLFEVYKKGASSQVMRIDNIYPAGSFKAGFDKELCVEFRQKIKIKV